MPIERKTCDNCHYYREKPTELRMLGRPSTSKVTEKVGTCKDTHSLGREIEVESDAMQICFLEKRVTYL